MCQVYSHEVVYLHCLCPVLQEGDFLVRTHHVEYCDGGILDPDDILSDLVEDKDKVRPFQVRMSYFVFAPGFNFDKVIKDIGSFTLTSLNIKAQKL